MTVLYDAPVRSVVMDRAERFLFAGLQSGDIIQTALSDWEAVGRTGTADKLIDLTTTPATPDAAVEEKEEEEEEVIEVEGELPSKQEEGPMKKRAKKTTYSSKQSSAAPKVPRAVFSGHTASVTCLAVSIDGLGLLSGSADRSSKLWHIKSRQSMRTCSAAYRGALSNLLVVPAPGGLFLYDSLEAQMSSLMEPAAQISTDISFKSAAGPSTSRGHQASSSSSTAYKVPLFLNSSSSSGRPATYEALMKRAAQPPPPIVPFKREIYRPGSKTNTNSGPWKAFERGVIMVANDDCSGQDFWPWEGGWAMPSEADIERIFTSSSFSASSRPRLSLEGGSGSRSRQGKGSKLSNGINGGGGDANGNDQEEEEEEGEGMTMSEQSKDELIAQLRHQNEQLYHLAVDEVFRSSITRKPSTAIAEEDEEAEKVPSGSS